MRHEQIYERLKCANSGRPSDMSVAPGTNTQVTEIRYRGSWEPTVRNLGKVKVRKLHLDTVCHHGLFSGSVQDRTIFREHFATTMIVLSCSEVSRFLPLKILVWMDLRLVSVDSARRDSEIPICVVKSEVNMNQTQSEYAVSRCDVIAFGGLRVVFTPLESWKSFGTGFDWTRV